MDLHEPSMFHNLTVLSAEPLAIKSLSIGLKATLLIYFVWPLKLRTSSPFSIDHNFKLLSHCYPVKTCVCSKLKHIEFIKSASITLTYSPISTHQIIIFLSLLELAKYKQSLLKATQLTSSVCPWRINYCSQDSILQIIIVWSLEPVAIN